MRILSRRAQPKLKRKITIADLQVASLYDASRLDHENKGQDAVLRAVPPAGGSRRHGVTAAVKGPVFGGDEERLVSVMVGVDNAEMQEIKRQRKRGRE